MATLVQTPSRSHHSYRHPSFSSVNLYKNTSYYKPASSYRTTSTSSAGMTSVSSYSSITSYTYNAGPSSWDNQPQILHGKLHKRSHSKEASASAPSPAEEEFFSTDSTQHKKGIIKPLLKKVQHPTGGNGKLDLSKPDGGAGGVYYSSSSPFLGGRTSATDLTSFVPTHRQQHKRTISGTSASSGHSGPSYPRRYVPTPTQSYPNSIGGEESSEEGEDDYLGEFSTTKYEATASKPVAPALKTAQSAAQASPLAMPPKIPISESAPISPITPLGRTNTMESFNRKQKVIGGRNSTEEYAESVRAARAEFEKREREKEQKEERRARRSMSKDEKRPSNDGAGGSSRAPSKSRWAFTRHSEPDLGATATEKTIGIPYGAGAGARQASSSRASLRGIVIRGAEDGRFSRADREKRGNGGIRNQWQGFVMWVRIGFVKMGRKVRNLF